MPENSGVSRTAASKENWRANEVTDQDKTIEPGDSVRILSGYHAGETGIAIDVMWYSGQSGLCAMVRVMSDVGRSDFYDMQVLEKVKGPLDNDPPFDQGERKWDLSDSYE